MAKQTPTRRQATPVVELTETELLRCLAQNLDDAFERMVLAYQDRLYALALRLSGAPCEAEEIAQDAFVRAYRAMSTYAPERIEALRLRAWLYQITINLWRNRARRLRLPTQSLDVSLDDANSTSGPERAPRLPAYTLADPDVASHPALAHEQREMRDELAARLSALPGHLRMAVVLRHVEGLPYNEIASLLKQPVGTVKSHTHRGVSLLREALLHDEER